MIDLYDVILSFDYENINTPIQQTAHELKTRLAAAGLCPGHGKTLHVVAHSMGGLVSRWFIEREGGNKVVQHLVMLGTPNAGSPWPQLQDWATVSLSLALNGLSATAWPLKTLVGLVAAIESVDVALDQMAPGSELLSDLATSPDPNVSYTVIAGDTAIKPFACRNRQCRAVPTCCIAYFVACLLTTRCVWPLIRSFTHRMTLRWLSPAWVLSGRRVRQGYKSSQAGATIYLTSATRPRSRFWPRRIKGAIDQDLTSSRVTKMS